MKRRRLLVLALAFALISTLSLTGYAFAAEQQGALPGKVGLSYRYHHGSQGTGFVDADSDGICDNYQNNEPGSHHPRDGHGDYCANYNYNVANDFSNASRGAQYQDTNSNGICDNREHGVASGARGSGAGAGSGHGGGGKH